MLLYTRLAPPKPPKQRSRAGERAAPILQFLKPAGLISADPLPRWFQYRLLILVRDLLCCCSPEPNFEKSCF